MAQRYGGKYSPDTNTPDPHSTPETGPIPAHRRPVARHPEENRPFWITLAAVPFLLGAFGEGPFALIRALAAFGLIAGAAWTIREGLRAEFAYVARAVARRPAFPRKILGSIAFGLGLAVGAQAPEVGLIGSIAIGALGTVISLVAFGLDPLKNKGMDGVDAFQQERVERVVKEGEAYLSSMRSAIAPSGERALIERVARFEASARDLFRVVQEDPGDLATARRYMTVYLEGARDATVKFADLWRTTRDAQARTDYEALLSDLEANFNARTKKMLEDGRDGLDVEIEVLRDRLAREGLATAPKQG
ncbi:5-bromo-4-chloroindolyl phosphate hydrolysis family protein [Thioclava sp.]|uniref:5-bromo-4-chloroindolyl phosphate hydrolysis family protein n=1 Tax=Thioclava sp. TaxID=1933450 RepID=UPI003AA7B7C5